MAKKKKKNKTHITETADIFQVLRDYLKQHRKNAFSDEQLIKKFSSIASKDDIRIALKKLREKNIVGDTRKGDTRYTNVLDRLVGEALVGEIDITRSGDAFVSVEGKEKDIYIFRKNTGKALDGDTVKVMRVEGGKSGRNEGVVTEVVLRKRTQFIGVVERSHAHCFVVPDNPNIHIDFFVPEARSKAAKQGDKVVVQMQEWKDQDKNPFGVITEVLGQSGSNDIEMKSILIENGFFTKFPAEVQEAADNIPMDIPEEEIARRRDLRKTVTFTIDPADAKDFDDAISYRELGEGRYEIGVHVADVSHYVEEGSVLDKEAFKRATSVYLVDRVAPMFPEVLSNIICSLRPNEDKLCFSAIFTLDDKARVLDTWYGRTVIHSQMRYSYEEAQVILEGGSGPFENELRTINSLAKRLRDERFRNGSVNFEAPETKFQLDEKGKPIGVYVKERKDAHMLIEDFMLLANKYVAQFIGKERNLTGKVPMVFRVHDLPNMEKLQDFALFAEKFGYRIQFDNPKQIAKALNILLEKIQGKPEQNLLESLAIRSMAKAIYTIKNIGHYGLGFEFYTHFTSPIRRYPDVMVHRIVHAVLTGAKLPEPGVIEYQCRHSSERERAAAEAERASVKYKMAEYMFDRVGERFRGVISGVKSWGVYVEIPEYNCEGLLRAEELNDDMYRFDERKLRFVGKHSGREYQLGDEIEVKLSKVDLEKKTIDFELP